eukprot:7860644-Pyramimonas_sp.AAC.1
MGQAREQWACTDFAALHHPGRPHPGRCLPGHLGPGSRLERGRRPPLGLRLEGLPRSSGPRHG